MTLDKLREREARGEITSSNYKPHSGNIWTLQDVKDRDCFGKISVLDNYSSKEAYLLIQSVAENVKVIMRRRKWYVEELKELDPSSKYLGLNVGHTLEIHLKLRGRRGLISYNDVVTTMLHELTHIIHSAHNDDFYLLFNKLKSEYENHYSVKLSNNTRTSRCDYDIEHVEQKRRPKKWKRILRRIFRLR